MSDLERLMLIIMVGLACPVCLPLVVPSFDEKKED